jgi:NAD(P)-dependent dehydrogenase (short-subunit alcohol dehydrogenase family)
MSGTEPKPLEGKTALVTGASMNLGAVTARTLAEQGATVAINYLSGEDEPAQVLKSLRPHGQPSYAIPGNLADGPQVMAVVEQALERLGGRVDILVNNAGPFNGQPFADLPEGEWDRILDVNLKAAYLAAQGVIPGMRQAGWGRIINMAAGSAFIRNHGIYGLAKGAVILLTEALALELGPQITVNAIAPGQIAESAPDISAIDPTFVGRAIAHSPSGRLVTRPEVAQLIAWLCSPPADQITGHTIPIDGGWRFNRF